jgi:hypothetical protein
MFYTKLVLFVLIFWTKLVLIIMIFCTELVVTILIFCTKLVLTRILEHGPMMKSEVEELLRPLQASPLVEEGPNAESAPNIRPMPGPRIFLLTEYFVLEYSC